jgi:hypothetical protein
MEGEGEGERECMCVGNISMTVACKVLMKVCY